MTARTQWLPILLTLPLSQVILEAWVKGVNPKGNSTNPSNWDFGSSFFFAGTVVTTIGKRVRRRPSLGPAQLGSPSRSHHLGEDVVYAGGAHKAQIGKWVGKTHESGRQPG